MLKNILNFKEVNSLDKSQQQQINGGIISNCFSGPEHLNFLNLPICPAPPDAND